MKRQTKQNAETPEAEGFGGGSKSDVPQMMDPDAVEVRNAVNMVSSQRVALSLTTLIDEVQALFPETTHEVIDFNGRKVGYSVSFATHESPGLADLILLISDPRVEGTIYDPKEELAFVSLHNNPRSMDSRDPFNLAEAWEVLAGAPETEEPQTEEPETEEPETEEPEEGEE